MPKKNNQQEIELERVTVLLEPEDYRKLQRLMETDNRNKSDTMRHALRKLFQREFSDQPCQDTRK